MTLRGRTDDFSGPHLRIFSPDDDDLADEPGVSAEGKPMEQKARGTSDTSAQQPPMTQTSLTTLSGKATKRVIDIVVSLPVVVCVLPPLAVLVRLIQWRQSPGPLFFRQERCGQQNRGFTILKFRTMNEESDFQESDSGPESRVFPLGHMLRRTKLDEIPQFVNVLTGAMSIVGPRPHHFKDVETFSEAVTDYAQRTIAKPGITGLAQYTEYRGDFAWNCVESRVEKDLRYIRAWSLWLDVQLIAKTADVIVRQSLSRLWQRRQLAVTAVDAGLKITSDSEALPMPNETPAVAQDAPNRRAA